MDASHRISRTLSCLLLTVAVAGCGGGGADPVVARATVPSPGAGSASGGVLVDVAGLVRRPGVYRLPAGARVHEAIAAAGGARLGADLASLNRAAALVDGQQVLVSAAVARDTGSGSGALVSINRADESALDELPGIGPVTAEHIVAERTKGGPFASIDDLDRVSGIGPSTIESLRDVATA